jgi:hypothetical protein
MSPSLCRNHLADGLRGSFLNCRYEMSVRCIIWAEWLIRSSRVALR